MQRLSRFQFVYWLRTGRVPLEPDEPTEVKFNPNHNPENGQFTFAGQGEQSGGGTSPHPVVGSGGTRARQSARRKELGSLSVQYETSGRGVSTVSSGKSTEGRPDPGGVSYGSYQLTSQTPSRDRAGHLLIIHDGGNVADFLKHDGAQWAPQFAGLAPGSEAFSNVWRRIAATDPEPLHAAEHEFVEKTYYDPAVERIKAATGLDIDRLDPAVKDVLWSAGVQHGPGSTSRKPGGATRIFVDAIKKTDSTVPRASPSYSRRLIDNVYTRRTQYWPSDRARYQHERSAALQMLGGH